MTLPALAPPVDSGRAAERWRALRFRLAGIAERHPDAALASSLSAEDMLLTHAIFRAHLPLRVFTLNTGRLHAETLELLERIESAYGRPLEIYHPDERAVRDYTAAHGAHAFYDSVELRRACCRIRKVEPLARALAGCSAWITGQRRAQAATREDLPEEERDGTFGLAKYNPLAAWNDEEIWQVIRARDIPYNPLHDRGYPSIGCEPCTRAVRPGEDARAGRWWWESSDSKECGLHTGHK
ncbi:MAG: phosphoadenylyl-sulfate reductase [Candidatus Accumulibacter sp.]|jgi:phosphoadenosine phosphosulfate reductase|nr:phosphoadenylyl-sulfate reductase [Accumulibacter sp.]